MNIEPKIPTRKVPAEWFTPGVRTAWHSHSVGQMLHATEGAGDGDGATWLEHVTDDQYKAAAAWPAAVPATRGPFGEEGDHPVAGRGRAHADDSRAFAVEIDLAPARGTD